MAGLGALFVCFGGVMSPFSDPKSKVSGHLRGTGAPHMINNTLIWFDSFQLSFLGTFSLFLVFLVQNSKPHFLLLQTDVSSTAG